jgi:GH15 family glucan-1,4-alpha-glucosidase
VPVADRSKHDGAKIPGQVDENGVYDLFTFSFLRKKLVAYPAETMDENTYPPIGDYGYIADCHSSALVSRSGSIDWCCMPRTDSGSCFGRLLDWGRGGYCQIVPSNRHQASRRYLDDTLILETTFRTEGGEARLLDCFTMRRGGAHKPHQQILRVVEGIKGQTEWVARIYPCFDYGATLPWIRRYRRDHYIAIGGNDGLLISGDFPLEMKDRHCLQGSCTVKKRERVHLSILYRPPEQLDDDLIDVPSEKQLDTRLDETTLWWHAWTSKGKIRGPYAESARRSAIILKGLSNAPTGAIAAAATTSLPETMKGRRNWDYRYTWIRDSCFTVRSLGAIGHVNEADRFRRFVERTAAGSADELQIVFGVGGERRLDEHEVPEMEGYRGVGPVRVGNAAAKQVQLDMYGELLDLAWRWHALGQSPDDDYWDFIVQLITAASERWRRPDHGIWEMRGRPRHFVFSKVMCWTALERGIRLAEDLGRHAPLDRWKKARDQIRSAVEKKGYDPHRGVFVQAFNRTELDASLLLLPTIEFVDCRDERFVRTTEAIRKELNSGGLIRRYPPESDQMEGEEGVFLACSFWLAECLARQGRKEEARKVFERALSAGNDLGLFPEEYDTRSRSMLGNFPQGLTHLSLITASVALAGPGPKI